MTTPTIRRCAALLLLGAVACTGACISKAKSSAARTPAATEPAAQYPLIVRLEGRHYSVSACSGPAGVVYTAHGRDGHLVVANATLDDLRLRHPEIYQQILPGIAEKREPSASEHRTTDAPADRVLLMDASR